MASLLDEVLGQADQTPRPLLQLPDERPPSLQPDPRADALGQTYKDITDYMAQQHRKGVDEGYWTGGGLLEGGRPTLKAFNSAADEYAQGLLLGTTSSGGKPSFNVYHGSPHKFAPTPKNPLGEFRDSQIGTGEGYQVYGLGHYGAEKEAVARGLRDTLSPKPSGPAVDAYNAANDAFKAKAAELSKARLAGDPVSDGFLAETDALRKQMIAAREAIPSTGHMYEVKVNADPESFLHWDKPLSEQHPDVRKALNDIGVAPPNASYTVRPVEGGHVVDYVDGNNRFSTSRVYKSAEDANRQASITMKMMNRDPTGAELVRQNQGIEAKLKGAGVPGIRYLDAGSRSKGEGTHNVVVFDPANMEIIRRYGLAGLMLGGGGLLSPNQQEQ